MKTAFITGASRGLGSAIAAGLAADGYCVAVNYSSGKESAEEVVKKIKCAGGKACTVKADISDNIQIDQAFKITIDTFGSLDVLVNNARLDPYKRPDDITDGEWFDRSIGVNLKGPFLCSLKALELMKIKGWGRIINISSVWAYRAAPGPMMEYAMCKAALHSLTRSLALLSAPFGITVNTIAPGMIMTEAIGERLSRERIAELSAGIPVKRAGDECEIVEAVRFALKNDYLCGETININGGSYMP
ncbi:MAG: hypothetical protein A2096_06005 [Spirochaetes bacterium GWF1_41_5]|nr:MAG: hypothetical protein A2096_06005 [Spirochaetes bacterium GWF1_41_5]